MTWQRAGSSPIHLCLSGSEHKLICPVGERHSVLPLACDFHAILNRCAHRGECCFKTMYLGRNMGSLEVAEWTHSSPGGNVSLYPCTGKRVQLTLQPRGSESWTGADASVKGSVQHMCRSFTSGWEETPPEFESQPSLSLYDRE